MVVKRSAHRCGLDSSWLQALGNLPDRSLVMHFDRLHARGGFGAKRPPATFAGFGGVERTSEEHYTFPATRALTPPDRAVVVLRGVKSPVPADYAREATLPGGVVEHRHDTGHNLYALFALPGGTWVRVQGKERIDAFRRFVVRSGPTLPPPPHAADVAWELCGDIDPNEVHLPFDRWPHHDQRVAVRLLTSGSGAEVVVPFASSAKAAAAAKEQRLRCASGKCGWLREVRASGRQLVVSTTVKRAPTSAHAVGLRLAERTPLLTAVPAPVAGRPPSGFYQAFVEVVEDTCPSHAKGKKDRGWHQLLEMRHDGRKMLVDLTSMTPRSSGLLDSSTIEGVELTEGKATRERWGHLCPNYAIETTMNVTKVAANMISVRDEVRHVGSTLGCRHPNLPSDCRSTVEITWVLRRPLCPAECDASYDGYYTGEAHGEPPNHVHPVCRCPSPQR